MSALNNFREKETSLTLGEDERLAETVRNHPYLYDETFEKHKEKDIVENLWKKLLKNYNISYKLLRPTQFLEKFLEILE